MITDIIFNFRLIRSPNFTKLKPIFLRSTSEVGPSECEGKEQGKPRLEELYVEKIVIDLVRFPSSTPNKRDY